MLNENGFVKTGTVSAGGAARGLAPRGLHPLDAPFRPAPRTAGAGPSRHSN
jgi:hypothetical protein